MAIKLPAAWIDTLENTPIVRDLTEDQFRRGALRLLPRAWVREGIVFDHYIREGRFQRSLALIAGGSALLASVSG